MSAIVRTKYFLDIEKVQLYNVIMNFKERVI